MALEGLKGTQLEAIWMQAFREPRYKVVIYNPRFATVQQVVLNTWGGLEYDISSWVERIRLNKTQVFENNDQSISSTASFDVVYQDADDEGLRLPDGRYIAISEKIFRSGTAIRVFMGDRRIDESDWPVVFTGVIRGFPSSQLGKRGKQKIRITAFGRAQAFQSQTIVGFSFPYNTDLGDAAVDVAIQELALERDEIRFGKFDFQTLHKSNALTQIGKMRGIYELMATVGRKPYFDGRGFLTSHVTNFDRAPALILENSPIVVEVTRLQNLRSTTNSVQVLGLNHVLSKVVNSSTKLGQIDVTVGYFDSHFRDDVYYSDDHRRRAEATFIRERHGGDFGGGSSWREIDEFHGQLSIDTGYAPWIIGLILFVWSVASYIEYAIDVILDEEASGLLADATFTRDVYVAIRAGAQALKAAAMIALLLAMNLIGRWTIDLFGKPFEYVFEELRSIAFLRNIPVADLKELEVSQHWISKIEDTDARARELLRRELAKAHPYRIRILGQGLLEVDDLIQIKDEFHGLPRFTTFYITSIEDSLTRGPAENISVLTCWNCRESDDPGIL